MDSYSESWSAATVTANRTQPLLCRAPAAVLLCLWGAGCAAPATAVDVDVQLVGRAAEVQQLEITGALGGVASPAVIVKRSLDRFSVRPPISAAGLLHLRVVGLGADRCALAEGDAEVMVNGPGVYPLRVELAATRGCRVTISVRKLGAAVGAVRLPDGTDCTDQCELFAPRDAQVVLGRSPAHFGGWYGDCPTKGHGDSCAVLVSAGSTAVNAQFFDPAALSCDPSGWCLEQNPPPRAPPFRALFAPGASEIIAVGADGTVLRSEGLDWTPQESGTRATLAAVWGSAGGDVWAAGAGGTLLRRRGVVWDAVSSGVTADLHGLWGSGPGDVFAVGDGGTILHFDGASWSPAKSPTQASLYAVWGSAASDVFAVGAAGTILRLQGGAWAPVGSNSQRDLFAISGSRPSEVFAVGDAGTILRWQGLSWRPFPSGVTVPLRGVWASGDAGALVVGDGGTLLRLGGLQWFPQGVPKDTRNLRAITGINSFDIWAVGEGPSLLRLRP